MLCSHKRTIGRCENYGSVSCVRFGVGFSASLCCIKVIQIHVRPSNPSMLSIKINISFYKNMFQHIFVPVMFKHVLCNCQKRYYWCKHLCIILKYKNLNIWLYCFFCLIKNMLISMRKFTFINWCMSVVVHMYRTCTK